MKFLFMLELNVADVASKLRPTVMSKVSSVSLFPKSKKSKFDDSLSFVKSHKTDIALFSGFAIMGIGILCIALSGGCAALAITGLLAVCLGGLIMTGKAFLKDEPRSSFESCRL
jgi:hypothetical protein